MSVKRSHFAQEKLFCGAKGDAAWCEGRCTAVRENEDHGLRAVRPRSYGLKSVVATCFSNLHHFAYKVLIANKLHQNKPTSNLHGTYMFST